jgi:DNA mismatch repair protein MutL
MTGVAEDQRLFEPAPAARAEPAVEPVASFPLGVARGQVAATYIVAEAEDGLVIVDQHAAHERLVLERMRAAREGGAVARQALLMPEVVELEEPECDRLEAAAGELAEMGLDIERFGPTAMLVRAGVEGVFDELLERARRPFDDLAGSDSIDEVGRQPSY